MAAKKNAVDRVIAELYAERDKITETIARLNSAKDAAAQKQKKPRKPREAVAPATEGSAR